MEVMDGTYAPVGSPVSPREQGLTLLQTVRGRYLSLDYDVPALLMTYVRLLDQLGSMSQRVKTCKVRRCFKPHIASSILMCDRTLKCLASMQDALRRP